MDQARKATLMISNKMVSRLQAVAQAGTVLTKVNARKEQLQEELIAS
jgi:hypothetical protein